VKYKLVHENHRQEQETPTGIIELPTGVNPAAYERYKPGVKRKLL